MWNTKSKVRFQIRIILPVLVSAFLFFFFYAPLFFTFQPVTVHSKISTPMGLMHCSWTHTLHFSITFSLKMDPMVLFIHLKIILLQYFQFLVFSFIKISSIQTDPKKTNLISKGDTNYAFKWKLKYIILCGF